MSNAIEPTILAKLWRQHAERLLVIARASGEPAEDAVQEAFVALAQQPVLPDDPLAWLVRTARNQLLQWRRGRLRRGVRERRAVEGASWFVTPSELAERLIDGHQVTAWLVELPQEDREVIVMHLWGEMSFRQIADITDESSATAHRRYQRGIEALRRRTDPAPKEIES